jgi:hypothetical protein
MEFKVGDKVRVVQEYYFVKNGFEGKIVSIKPQKNPPIGVRFNKKFDGGHNLGVLERRGLCRNGYGYWLWPDNLEKVKTKRVKP